LDDPSGTNPPITSKLEWFYTTKPFIARINDGGASIQKGVDSITIPDKITDKTSTVSMVGKYINVLVSGIPGFVSGNECYTTFPIGPILAAPSEIPSVSGVFVTGYGANVGDVLTGSYSYLGATPEGNSTYQWLVKNDKNEYVPIEGATDKTFTLTNDYYNKSIKFSVTAKDTAMASGSNVVSPNEAIVGNAAFNTYTNGDTGSYSYSSTATTVNGISDDSGGKIFTYGAADKPRGYLNIDLGKDTELSSSKISISSKTEDTYNLQYLSPAKEWVDIEEAGNTTPAPHYIPFAKSEMVFKTPITARYMRVLITRKANVSFMEIALMAKFDNAPTIALNGESIENVLIGETYVEKGATAHDVEDGDITSKIVKNGTVDTTTIGTYDILYSVTDTKNKTVSVKRTVNVAAGFKEDGDSAFGKTTTSSVGKNVSNIVDGNKYTG
ncbi:MAG: DUF5011 domain-containing protein, partial [Oscillospiraceae bacterium]